MITRKRISRFLWSRLVLTLLFSCLFSGTISLLLFPGKADSLESHQALTIAALVGVSWGFILTISSVTVFFNLDAWVAGNRLYNFFSYYFLPIAAVTSATIISPMTGAWLQFIAVTVPFFVIHTFFYLQFNKLLKTGE